MKRGYRRPFIPARNTGPLPERPVLERAQARELLTHWELTKDKDAVDRQLALMDKLYGEGAEQRIRQHMRDIARHERHA
jgi:hypothetical protein